MDATMEATMDATTDATMDATMDLYVERGGDSVYRFTVLRSITLCSFTSAIQHDSACSIRKANMRLHLRKGNVWEYFYSFRLQSAGEKAMLDKPLVSLGIEDGAYFQVEYVLSTFNALAIGAAVVAIPFAAPAVLGMGGAYMTGYVAGTVLAQLAMQQAFNWVVLSLPADFPCEVVGWAVVRST